MNNQLLVIDNLVPKDICEELIKADLGEERIMDTISSYFKYAEIPEGSDYVKQLTMFFWAGYNEYVQKLGLKGFAPKFQKLENFKRKSYFAGDCFEPHVDVCDVASSQRFLGFLLYLNDVEVGGETIYYSAHGANYIKPRAGSVLIFPPFWLYPHASLNVPKDKEKHIITGYALYPC